MASPPSKRVSAAIAVGREGGNPNRNNSKFEIINSLRHCWSGRSPRSRGPIDHADHLAGNDAALSIREFGAGICAQRAGADSNTGRRSLSLRSSAATSLLESAWFHFPATQPARCARGCCVAGKVGRRRFELRLRPPEGRRMPSYPTGPHSRESDGRV